MTTPAAASETRTVDLRSAPGRPFSRLYRECIGSCHAYLTLREDWREQVRDAQREIGFRQMRFHGIFHDLVGICRGVNEDHIVFNFNNLDKIYDFLLDQGIRPFVELGFMPEALASGTQTCFHYRANVTPPKSQELWAQLIHGFTAHLIERYGLDEVAQWPFEVWNEPDLDYFWAGTREEYFTLYETTVRTLKALSPRLQVGGPATSKGLWVKEMLAFCAGRNLPLDFISTHHYCADVALVLDKPEGPVAYRGQKVMRADVAKTLGLIDRSAFPAARLHYTEWNVSPAHVDRFGKDSEFTATFVLQTLRDLGSLPDSYSFWTVSDVFEESGPGEGPFSGKYGLISLHGIHKPAFHAYRFLARQFDEELTVPGAESVILTRAGSRLRLLTWNHNEPEQVDFEGGEWRLREQPRQETLHLDGLADGVPVRIRAWRVDRTHGNALRAWQALGAPAQLSRSQVAILKGQAEPVPVLDETRLPQAGRITLEHTLTPCAILQYELAPAAD